MNSYTSALRNGVAAPTLVLDLDDTVLGRSRGVHDTVLLYAWTTPFTGVPYPGAIESVNRLSRNFRIVAVTARWNICAPNTERWLVANGLAGLPVVHASRPHPGDASRIAFKLGAIERLRAEGWAPIAGVGDRPSDVEAYARAGLATCVVAHARAEESGSIVAQHLNRAYERWSMLTSSTPPLPATASIALFAIDHTAVVAHAPHLANVLSHTERSDAAVLLPGSPPPPVWQQVESYLDGRVKEGTL